MAIEFSDRHGEIIIGIVVDSYPLVVVSVVSIDIFLTLSSGDLVFLSVVFVADVDGRCGEEDVVSFFFFFFFCLAAALDDDATDDVKPSSIDEFIDIMSSPFINSFVVPILSLTGDGPMAADEKCMGLSLSFFAVEGGDDRGGGGGGTGGGAVHKA
jgi:hypothetical protein